MIISIDKTGKRFIKGSQEISRWLGFSLGEGGIPVSVGTGESLCVDYKGGECLITVAEDCEFFKGLALLCAALEKGETEYFYEGKRSMKTLSYMTDCSRNAVANTESLKELIRYLAAAAFNELQLYTEDVYEIEGERYFGALRGRYSAEEIREIDEYCKLFGIELVPCIQTLAHLNGITCQPHYREITDVNDILLAEEEKTYELIEKMFSTAAENYTSRKINIGLDEAHMLGLGSYLEKNGYRNKYDIMLRHLKRVCAIAGKYGFQPMMWSDMFFRIASGGNYYGDGEIPQSVIDDVPKEVSLVYWDYDHTTQDEYDRMFARHRLFKNNIRFTTAVWKWIGLAPEYKRSDEIIRQGCLACIRNRVDEFMLSSWGDNGAECSLFSLLSAVYEISGYTYGKEDGLFEYTTGMDKREYKDAELINRAVPERIVNPGKYLLYNDYFCGIFDRHTKEEYPRYYVETAKKLRATAEKGGKLSYIFTTLALLAEVLSLKSRLGVDTRAAYQKKDRKELSSLLGRYMATEEKIGELSEAFRRQWRKENKPFGFEIQELRLGGLLQRTISCRRRIEEYLRGEVEEIEELKENVQPYYEELDGEDIFINFWNRMISPNVVG